MVIYNISGLTFISQPLYDSLVVIFEINGALYVTVQPLFLLIPENADSNNVKQSNQQQIGDNSWKYIA